MKYRIILLLLSFQIISCGDPAQSSQGEDFLNNVNQVGVTIVDDSEMLTFFDNARQPIQPKFTMLPTGSNQPRGWLLNIMQHDLQNGVVGALDELYPGIAKDDLYYTARRGGLEDVPEMGDLELTGAAWEKSIMWWNAETIGNWWDGFVRHAFLTKDEKAMDQSHKIVKNLLASQDQDGYIGIYKENLRYQHEGSNGELWAQTTAFRMLLAYYELTDEKNVLEAVEKAMALTMKEYGEEGRNPFYLKNAFGGVTHGLMLTDVCETLYRITGNQEYQDYATYLYRAFSTYSVNRAFNDFRYPYLEQKDSLFTGHAVHTYEHLRTLINAYYHTGYPELKTAYENALYKLDQCLLPSGAGHGNEWILGLKADPNYTTTEFCTMLELRNSFGSALQKTGDAAFGDKAEKLTFNGIMGFRNPSGTAITYGKGDNCFVLDGQHHGHEENHKDVRYKYSPTHSDPAVCCVPNYTRNFTYYLDQMWMKVEDGLVAAMYGPSLLSTSVEDIDISIDQQTNYPFSDKITFDIQVDKPASFSLYFRKPHWCQNINIDVENATITEKDGYIKVNKEWQIEDKIELSFEQEVMAQSLANQEVYFQRGPLVYAYSIPHREEVIKEYEQEGYYDYYCFPESTNYQNLSISDAQKPAFEYEELSLNENPWYQSLPKLKTDQVELVPMGSTVLRRVSFPKIVE